MKSSPGAAKWVPWLLAFAFTLPLQAEKTDVVVLRNGDRLTGEIKLMERGKLKFKTDATGTIYIEWDDIATISSSQVLQLELDTGERYTGLLMEEEQENMLRLGTDVDIVTLPIQKIVNIEPIESNFRDRIKGDIRAGYNYTLASDISQFNFGLDVDYRTELNIFSLDLDGNFTDSTDSDTNTRVLSSFGYTNLRPKRWLLGLIGSYERNDQLGLDKRLSAGAGAGRFLRQTNHNQLRFIAGLLISREDVAEEDSAGNALESTFSIDYDWYRYDDPELDISLDFEVIPSLSDFGRVRAQVDLNLDWEVVNDLFLHIGFYDSYDNEASGDEAVKNDYGIVTSVVWKL
ncbi:MAG: DUF481 domain-containing protein [Acidobacteriota bacterium]|nr:DUF481 domain-containing protein [Acidobacteriota bacterium]